MIFIDTGAFLARYAAVSFTDAVSCVLMRRHHLTRTFSFDRHFEDMGFSLFKP